MVDVFTEINAKLKSAFELHKAGELCEAEGLYREILELCPNNLDTLNFLGVLKTKTKHYSEAIEFLKKAFELAPEDFDVLFNLALAYKKNQQFDEALCFYQKALQVDSDNPDVYFNMANVYENMGDTPSALKYFELAKKYGVKDPNIDYFLAVSYLKVKDFEKGWKYYESRPSKPFGILTQELQYGDLVKSKPLWRGESLEGKKLFVYYEAGLGDTLMYARYIPVLAEMCKEVLFKPQSNLVELLEGSNLGAKIIDMFTPIEELEFDYHVPLMSLPFLLKHNLESDIPFADKFLSADKELAQEFKSKFFANNKFKIGIKWQGNPAYDRHRIVPLEAFCPLFDLPDVQFYSLQKDDGAEELQNLPSKYSVMDLGKEFNSFSDTAAAIETLDLVICNDTSVAHLVAAMGKPCWVLLPTVSNWRWHTDVSYSPWYNSVKLFQQSTAGNWVEVIEKVMLDLL